ncbi:hypothetical protein CPAR01_02061 [Colletotrichum paranaense]|uniref:Secreted protein n=1 Tax=Colletotrichum paranaense TaxID=1914294 RepID=A0ABQ9SYJ5_9PEZI|nr:uncharacterized protein CPAR01_02061 [Colletotrichum paranaense]KAK1544559.1 hypothetical protein CPAR01_02061 [Colletotrichum paranaense]
MKLFTIALLAPLASAVCSTSQLSLTFMVSNFYPYEYETEEFCPVAGSCVNMASGADSWSQKANWVLMKANTCVQFYKDYNCPQSGATWEPPCHDVDWAVGVLSDWSNGAMKSYTVFQK